MSVFIQSYGFSPKQKTESKQNENSSSAAQPLLGKAEPRRSDSALNSALRCDSNLSPAKLLFSLLYTLALCWKDIGCWSQQQHTWQESPLSSSRCCSALSKVGLLSQLTQEASQAHPGHNFFRFRPAAITATPRVGSAADAAASSECKNPKNHVQLQLEKVRKLWWISHLRSRPQIWIFFSHPNDSLLRQFSYDHFGFGLTKVINFEKNYTLWNLKLLQKSMFDLSDSSILLVHKVLHFWKAENLLTKQVWPIKKFF